MTQLTLDQWFEDTIKNIEGMYFSDGYPKDELIQEMRRTFDLWKKYEGSFLSYILSEESETTIPHVLIENIRLHPMNLYSMFNKISDKEKSNQLSYSTIRKECLKFERFENVTNPYDIFSLAGTRPYEEDKKYMLEDNILSLLKEQYSNVCVAPLSLDAKQKYEDLFASDALKKLPLPSQMSLAINDVPLGIYVGPLGWADAKSGVITLQTPNSYALIHETFHRIDDDIEKKHQEKKSCDERISFFHELYQILSQYSNSNVVNPFDYIEYNNQQEMQYKPFTVYKYFNTQLNSLVSSDIFNTNSFHWFQSWISFDVRKKGKYFTKPNELLARLYTTAYSIVYPELDNLIYTIKNYSTTEFRDALSLAAQCKELLNNHELQEKVRDWLMRFHDYVNATLFDKERKYAPAQHEVLPPHLNDVALKMLHSIQQACLNNMPKLNAYDKMYGAIFSVVHYKNAQINNAFNEHVVHNLETYYKTSGLSLERKSHQLIQAFVDYHNGVIPAQDIMKKIGFSSVTINDSIATEICQKYKTTLEDYQKNANQDFTYQEPPVYI